jgi:glycosyltransferase involved in cell wall biosynthesis
MKSDEINGLLIITSEAFPYGMAGSNRIISLSKGFMANNLDVQVLSIYKYGKPEARIKFPTEGAYEEVKYINILSSARGNQYGILRVLKRNLLSILVFHYCVWKLKRGTLVLYYSPWVMPAIVIKVVTFIKGIVLIKEETEHPLIRLKNKSKLYKYFYLKYYYTIFDGLFVITHRLYQFFREEINYKKILLIVPMIVDIDSFHSDNNRDNKSIVFSGELDVQKEGLDLLFGAFARILEKFPDFKLDLYGKPVDSNQECHIKKMISELEIAGSVNLHGYKTRNELIEILFQAHILIFTRPPSLQATFGFSTKLGEYLATGKPVVTTSVGEIERYLTDRFNAFVCEPKANSIADKIFEVINDYNFALTVGSRGRMCALECFNNKIETRKIIDQVQAAFPKNDHP